MKFRRRTFRRRRTGLFQMQPLHICPFQLLWVQGPDAPTCDTPVQFATEIPFLAGALPFASQSIAKGILIKGINFQYDFSTIGEVELGAFGFMEARSALVRLPKDPLTGTVSFIPNLFTSSEVLVTERVLWRGRDIMWTWDSANGSPLGGGGDSRLGNAGFSTSVMPGNASAQPNIRVKTACRVKENESIFFVTNVVNSFINTTFHWDLTLFGSAAVRQIVT